MLPFYVPSIIFLLVGYLVAPASSLPILEMRSLELSVRQVEGGLAGPTTFITSQTTQTAAGLLTETCTITLTPIVETGGQSAVQEVKECSVQLDSDAPGSVSSSEVTSSGTTELLPAPSSSGSVTDSTASQTPAVAVDGTSSVSPTSVSIPAEVEAPASATPLATASTSDAPAASATDTSEGPAQPTSEADFEMPGRSLQVLPIGLGIFCGITAIALIVVGTVTYERTKYRKAFRQRKLAEVEGSMGYGGMAEFKT